MAAAAARSVLRAHQHVARQQVEGRDDLAPHVQPQLRRELALQRHAHRPRAAAGVRHLRRRCLLLLLLLAALRGAGA